MLYPAIFISTGGTRTWKGAGFGFVATKAPRPATAAPVPNNSFFSSGIFFEESERNLFRKNNDKNLKRVMVRDGICGESANGYPLLVEIRK